VWPGQKHSSHDPNSDWSDAAVSVAELIFAAVSAVAAAIAAFAAVRGLRLANASARESARAAEAGRQSADAAQETVRLAEAARRAAERERERHDLEFIGDLVERLHWVGELEAPEGVYPTFRSTMNLLRRALIGREGSLPKTALVLQAASADYVKGLTGAARLEIDAILMALEPESGAHQD
jgi:hypothetical protein